MAQPLIELKQITKGYDVQQNSNHVVLMDTMHLVLLPDVPMEVFTDFLALLNGLNEKMDLYKLAEKLVMNIEDFFPIVDAVALLGFTHIQEGDIELTEAGRQFAKGSVIERKRLFCKQLLCHVPMINQILYFLEAKNNEKMHIDYFEDVLKGYFTTKQVTGQLDILIRWGRYAEAFAYDDQSRQFYIEQDNG